jgi:hypothetical protein
MKASNRAPAIYSHSSQQKKQARQTPKKPRSQRINRPRPRRLPPMQPHRLLLLPPKRSSLDRPLLPPPLLWLQSLNRNPHPRQVTRRQVTLRERKPRRAASPQCSRSDKARPAGGTLFFKVRGSSPPRAPLGYFCVSPRPYDGIKRRGRAGVPNLRRCPRRRQRRGARVNKATALNSARSVPTLDKKPAIPAIRVFTNCRLPSAKRARQK